MQQAIDTNALPHVAGATVAILCSKWYGEIVASMRRKCAALLRARGARVTVHTLPGCFEFPYAANELAQGCPKPSAIVCLGVILKGDTYHFEMIADECVRGLGAVAIGWRVPVINEILPVTDIAQAEARAADDDLNKGIEAAAAAIEIIDWRRRLDAPYPGRQA